VQEKCACNAEMAPRGARDGQKWRNERANWPMLTDCPRPKIGEG